jgi:hypothetical protein
VALLDGVVDDADRLARTHVDGADGIEEHSGLFLEYGL